MPTAAPVVLPTRTRVLDAAVGLFGTRGYQATSLDQVAEASGVRKQTLLYHFGDKEDGFPREPPTGWLWCGPETGSYPVPA